MGTFLSMQPLKAAFIATYPPRQCGIATFTADILNNLQIQYKSSDYFQVVALDKETDNYVYGSEVSFIIRTQHLEDYQRAAEYINHSEIDVVSLQHEFGIFGGKDGNNILHLLNALEKPVVTTLHTILKEPTPGQLETLQKIIAQSKLVVVLAKKAISLLQEVYQIPREKIVLIHHGTPDFPFLDPAYYKEQFKAEGKKTLLTFGLLSPNKGIEYVIKALPEVVKQFPDTVYFVVGATHPEVLRQHGQEYRNSLEKLVKDYHLEKNVVFYNQYVTNEQLFEFIKASDLYINPYINKEQISSGTLAYAVASGKAVISTPYWYAEELLSDGRGCLVPFCDSSAIAASLIKLLSEETTRDKMRKEAYQFGRKMIWSEVVQAYDRTFKKALLNYKFAEMPLLSEETDHKKLTFPEVNLQHLYTLTDDTGLLQHATFSIPNRFHGYCTDDNARALIVATMNWQHCPNEEIIPLLDVYLSFLNYALDEENQHLRNFMSYNREWLEEAGSEDSHGRTIWALGYLIAYPPDDALLCLANRLFRQIIGQISDFTSPRAWAFTIIGSLYYLKQFGGDTEVQAIVKDLSNRLFDLFKANACDDWFWCEDIVTYDNARLSQALIAAGHYLEDQEMTATGLKSLQWLIDIQTNSEEGHLSIVGNNGWYRRGSSKARFDQQPLEVAALVAACYQAYLVTKQSCWSKYMNWSFNWFLGQNDLYYPVYNETNGGCYDGIRPGSVNQNQGAESTLSYLMALHQMYQLINHHLIKKEKQNNAS